MDNSLPKVYAAKIEENLKNTQEVFYSSKDMRSQKSDNLTIESKINNIFNSKDYIYKKEVIISFKDKEERKVIIGRTNSSLLTFNNEHINISDIIDIKIV